MCVRVCEHDWLLCLLTFYFETFKECGRMFEMRLYFSSHSFFICRCFCVYILKKWGWGGRCIWKELHDCEVASSIYLESTPNSDMKIQLITQFGQSKQRFFFFFFFLGGGGGGDPLSVYETDKQL